MKIRSGFVSNSSSASFVVVGVKISDEELAKIFKIDVKNDDELFDTVDESEFFREWEDEIFGILIAEKHSDGEMETTEMSIDEFARKAMKVAEKTGKDVKEVKLYTGERMC